MRTRFYFTAVGTKQHIQTLSAGLAVSRSKVRRIRAPDAELWRWSTEYVICKTDFPTDELEAFVEENWSRLRRLRRYADNCDIAAVIVSDRNQRGDRPEAYSFSRETIQRLCKIGAALDIDVIWHPDE